MNRKANPVLENAPDGVIIDTYGFPTVKTRRIRAGLYEYTDYKGRNWVFECCEWDFPTVWHSGTENDPHADQYFTLWEAKREVAMFLIQGH
jgi:hypothetical protein